MYYFVNEPTPQVRWHPKQDHLLLLDNITYVMGYMQVTNLNNVKYTSLSTTSNSSLLEDRNKPRCTPFGSHHKIASILGGCTNKCAFLWGKKLRKIVLVMSNYRSRLGRTSSGNYPSVHTAYISLRHSLIKGTSPLTNKKTINFGRDCCAQRVIGWMRY